MAEKSEIRDSQIRDLLEKVRKRNYGSYLRSIFLKKIRHFDGATINFDFPVTALVGPNGSGKSTVLAAAACAYSTATPKDFFFTSVVGDQQDFVWEMEYELIDRQLSPTEATRVYVKMTREGVELSSKASRPVKAFGIHRTLPAVTSPTFMRKYLGGSKWASTAKQKEIETEFVRREASRVLGKELSAFKLYDVEFTVVKVRRLKNKYLRQLMIDGASEELIKQLEALRSLGDQWRAVSVPKIQSLFVSEGKDKYSEFNFGTGEASVLRLIHGIEQLPEQSLVLIEEIENGLHPLAVERLVEYLIAFAIRRKSQIVFTTHSEYALRPLPAEAVWSVLDGRVIQGSLSVESLRALSGRVDKKLAVFTEDQFSLKWVEAIVRETLADTFDQVGIYHLSGDNSAVRIHLAHRENPSVQSKSLCFIDGDSRQTEEQEKGIYRLPGESPELHVFNTVSESLEKLAAILTVGCQRPLSSQQAIVDAIRDVANTNRDPHLLFAQVGARIGLVSEEIVRGAFVAAWIQERPEEAAVIGAAVLRALD